MSTYRDSLDAARGVFVGGTFRPGGAGVFDVENPADRTVVAQVADGDTADATAAVEAANAALASWRVTPGRERSEMLHRTFDLMMRDQHELAELIVDENGKSRTDARAEVAYAAEFFRWFAEEAVRSGGDYGASPAGGARTVVTHRPVGVAALVTPWNFPAAMATRKIAPALARAAPWYSSRHPKHRSPQSLSRGCWSRPVFRAASSTSCRPPTRPAS